MTLLVEATIAYNAAPNAYLNESPFRRLFGMDSAIPGLPMAREIVSESQRQYVQEESRILQSLRHAVEVQDSLSLQPIRNIKTGDLVVYYLTDWQYRSNAKVSGHFQYTSKWSLPHRVMDIENQRVVVKALSQRGAKDRVIPLRLCRKLAPDQHRGAGRRTNPEREDSSSSSSSSSSDDSVEPKRRIRHGESR